MLRALSILCLVVAAIQVAFWIADIFEGQPFHGEWLLLGSVVWAAVFFLLSRRNKQRDERVNK